MARDLSDFLARIDWAKQHDRKARKISKNDQKFAQDHLLPQNVLSRWSGLIKNKVEVGEGMERVKKVVEMNLQ